MIRRNCFQDPDAALDNPYFLDMYEKMEVNPEVEGAYISGEIENQGDREFFIEYMWKKYPQWLFDEMHYEVIHE